MFEFLSFILLIALIVTIVRYVKYKKFCEKEFRHYEERIEEEISKVKDIEIQQQSEIHYLKSTQGKLTEDNFVAEDENKNDNETVKALIFEIETLRKEKEQELKLRLESEKQVELAIQKTKDVEKKIEDWKIIQNANLSDATDIMTKIGKNMYERLSEEYKIESKEIVKEISKKLDNADQNIDHQNTTSPKNTKQTPQEINNKIEILHKDLEKILEQSGLEPEVNYFTHYMIPESKRKSIPCEALITLDSDYCLILDTKSLRYFEELSDGKSWEIFEQKMERYINYLCNPKYKSNIIHYFSLKEVIDEDAYSTLVLLVPSSKELDQLKKLKPQYLQTLEDNNIEIHDLNSLSELIIDS